MGHVLADFKDLTEPQRAVRERSLRQRAGCDVARRINPVTRYTPAHIEALTNHDGLRATPPFKSAIEQRQYYGRYLGRYLWRYLTPADWHTLAAIIDDLKISPKIKRATKFLLPRHLG